jgi:hypothetical protein
MRARETASTKRNFTGRRKGGGDFLGSEGVVLAGAVVEMVNVVVAVDVPFKITEEEESEQTPPVRQLAPTLRLIVPVNP